MNNKIIYVSKKYKVGMEIYFVNISILIFYLKFTLKVKRIPRLLQIRRWKYKIFYIISLYKVHINLCYLIWSLKYFIIINSLFLNNTCQFYVKQGRNGITSPTYIPLSAYQKILKTLEPMVFLTHGFFLWYSYLMWHN